MCMDDIFGIQSCLALYILSVEVYFKTFGGGVANLRWFCESGANDWQGTKELMGRPVPWYNKRAEDCLHVLQMAASHERP